MSEQEKCPKCGVASIRRGAGGFVVRHVTDGKLCLTRQLAEHDRTEVHDCYVANCLQCGKRFIVGFVDQPLPHRKAVPSHECNKATKENT